MDIVEFLTARLEDLELDAGELHNIHCDVVQQRLRDPGFGWECTCGDPARVLADVAAKRLLINEYVTAWAIERRAVADADRALSDDEAKLISNAPSLRVLQILAYPYRDHADFDPDWQVS